MLVNAAHVILLTDIFISGKLAIKFIKCFNVIFVYLYNFFVIIINYYSVVFGTHYGSGYSPTRRMVC